MTTWRASRLEPTGAPSAVTSLAAGTIPEWQAKAALAEVGVPFPAGALAATDEEAFDIANRIGYPVAAKVQAAELPHKTDAGVVAVGIGVTS